MKKKTIGIIIPWALVILWMAIIFLFSHQAATESAQLSSGITRKIVQTISNITPKINLDQEVLSHFIRKGAHFGVYFILGILVVNALIISNKPKMNLSKLHIFIIGLFICVLYAISDEVHQLFIPGRSGELRDVLLDSSGALAGIVALFIIRK